MHKLSIYISGQKAFGADVFRLVRSMGHVIAGVSSPAHASDGKSPDRLRAQADLVGVPWLEAGLLRAETLPAGVDLILAAHSHDFIGSRTRASARLGAVGYHPSLLPRHRGRDAVRWTVHMGDPVTGGTVYWLSEQMDGGDIAAQDFVFVGRDETPKTLWRDKLAPLGIDLFRAVLTDLADGVIRRAPQTEEYATFEPSWGRPPVARPDLLMIGAGPDGFITRKQARRARKE